MKYTFAKLLDIMEFAGNNFACYTMVGWMRAIEAYTGIFPEWEDFAPDWLVNAVFGKEVKGI